MYNGCRLAVGLNRCTNIRSSWYEIRDETFNSKSITCDTPGTKGAMTLYTYQHEAWHRMARRGNKAGRGRVALAARGEYNTAPVPVSRDKGGRVIHHTEGTPHSPFSTCLITSDSVESSAALIGYGFTSS